jgi:uncharacterized protein involved in copper resistance
VQRGSCLIAGHDGAPMMRTSASIRTDFQDMFKTWAKVSVQGLTELKSLSLMDTSGIQKT